MVIRRKLHDKNDTIEALDSRIAQRKYHGKVIVSAIAITNVLESIPLCFIGEFNIVQLLIQPILLIALLFGVRWVRCFFI